MLTNADITIYNRRYNEQTRLDEWKRTVIKGVSFYHDVKTEVGENGLNKADVYKIRIPVDIENASEYVEAENYNGTGWTLQDSDIIVKGICDTEIEKPSDLTKNHVEVCKIASFSDNRRGNLPHWRVGGE